MHRTYRRMSQMGVPHLEVQKRMKRDGVDDKIIENYPPQPVRYTTPRATASLPEDQPDDCEVRSYIPTIALE